MNKKRDKKKFKRRNVRINNVKIDDIDNFEQHEVREEKRAKSKLVEKSEFSQKSNMELEPGRVLEVHSNHRCLVKLADETAMCTVGGRLKQVNFTSRRLIAAGDFVQVDVINGYRIEEIAVRKNSLIRFTDESFQREIVIASNIDQVIVTTSAHRPEINFGLVDRYICSAELFGIKPIICINKIDLETEDDDFEYDYLYYEDNGYKVILTSVETGQGIAELKEILKDRETVFSGPSGVGKSSLINYLQPGLNLTVSQISDYNDKGTHTTTTATMKEWDFGGYLVDTPGIKTFSLNKTYKELLARSFPGFKQVSKLCKFNNCTHTHEIKCAVQEQIETGHIPVERYESYLRILESLV